MYLYLHWSSVLRYSSESQLQDMLCADRSRKTPFGLGGGLGFGGFGFHDFPPRFPAFSSFFWLRSSLKIHEFTVDFTVLTLISVVSVWVSVQKSSAKFKLRRAQFLTSHLFRGQRWKPKLSWGKACHAELVHMHDVSKTFVFKERRYTHAISCNHMISYAPHASLHVFYSHTHII